MLLTFGNTRGFRSVAVGLLAGVAAVAFTLDTADARGRRHRVAKGGGYNPPYAAIVVDANSGQILHAAEADGIRHPASLTKIMTLYLLFERMEAGKIRPDTPLKVSAHAASQSPTKLGLKPGQTITADEAIRGLVTRSANDAAVVIAEALAGDEDDFAKLMTRKARALGMSRTVYMNASGLPNSAQVTTARDQAILGRAIQERFPAQYRYFSISSFAFRGTTIRNHNRLLGSVQGVDGIKTGYVRASGFNLVSSMKRNNRHLVAVVLGGASAGARDARMRSLLEKHIAEASTRRTAPLIAEARDADAPAPQMMLASAGSVPYAPATPAAAAAAMPAKTMPPAAARIERPAPGKIETARVESSRSEPTKTVDPIKPIQVKTIKVKLGGVQTASLTPPLAHLPVMPVHQDEPAARAAARAAVAPAPVGAPAPASQPVRTAAAAAMPAQPVAAPVQIAVAAVPARPAVAAALPPAPVQAQAPAQLQPAVAVAPAPAPAPVAVASAEPESTFALASASARPESTARRAVRGGWVIQIGAFGAEAEAKDRLSSAQAKAKQYLGQADAFTEAVTRDNKTFYRARFAGFEKDSAEAACKYLKRNDFACLTIKY
ncbi:peptidase M15 [Rhodoplanes serenus]|uniref:Peptidase M15 n=2 Tax=Rhodoplanes serenus TaxID=200615 RepID=A0A9X4XPN7_9BRAD|nr:D-alanyl-D-alanine carboxypeptidase [Rhodoplanes serenus]MTW17354.1 peptidase M15 [Rhodoplanes serenus]